MTYAQTIQDDYVNRKKIPAPNEKVRDYVFVNAKNLCSKQQSKKLDFKVYDPYFVDKIISPYVYQLLLTLNSNAYPIFHINKLCLAPGNPLSSQQFFPSPLL